MDHISTHWTCNPTKVFPSINGEVRLHERSKCECGQRGRKGNRDQKQGKAGNHVYPVRAGHLIGSHTHTAQWSICVLVYQLPPGCNISPLFMYKLSG